MFANQVSAMRAVAGYLGMPLAKLPAEQMGALEATLARTMNKREIMEWVRQNLRNTARR